MGREHKGGVPDRQGIETRQAKTLISLMKTHFITQMTEEPTFGSGNILDLILNNNDNLVSSI